MSEKLPLNVDSKETQLDIDRDHFIANYHNKITNRGQNGELFDVDKAYVALAADVYDLWPEHAKTMSQEDLGILVSKIWKAIEKVDEGTFRVNSLREEIGRRTANSEGIVDIINKAEGAVPNDPFINRLTLLAFSRSTDEASAARIRGDIRDIELAARRLSSNSIYEMDHTQLESEEAVLEAKVMTIINNADYDVLGDDIELEQLILENSNPESDRHREAKEFLSSEKAVNYLRKKQLKEKLANMEDGELKAA